MAKDNSDLSEDWYNGPEEIKDDWIVVDYEPKLHREKSHGQSGHSSKPDPSNPKETKTGVKTLNQKFKKRETYLKAKSSVATVINLKNMTAGWIQKAVKSIGV
jgi:hypothetical protein